MNIRKIIREELGDEFDWIRDVPENIPEINDQNKYMVLVNILGVDEVFGDVTGFDDPNTDFKQNDWDHYGIDTFTLNNGEVWAVGFPDDFDDALFDFWYYFVDDVGIGGVVDAENYLEMGFRRDSFARDEAQYYIGELSDEEIIGRSSFEESWNELNVEIEGLEEELEDENTYGEKLSEIEKKIKLLEKEKNNLINRAREEVEEDEYQVWYDCLEDPYRCLVRLHGIYSNLEELLDSDLVWFDKDKFATEMRNESTWSSLPSYNGDYYEDSGYVAMRID